MIRLSSMVEYSVSVELAQYLLSKEKEKERKERSKIKDTAFA